MPRDDGNLSTFFAVLSDDFEGDENPSDVFDGDDVNRVVVVVDVVDLRGDRDLLFVSTLMFFSLNGLRIGTVGSPKKQLQNNLKTLFNISYKK